MDVQVYSLLPKEGVCSVDRNSQDFERTGVLVNHRKVTNFLLRYEYLGT